MQAALTFQAKETRFFFCHPRLPLARGVRISDRQIAFLPQRMVFQVVGLQILMNLTVVPVNNRQHFKHAALHAQYRQCGAAA